MNINKLLQYTFLISSMSLLTPAFAQTWYMNTGIFTTKGQYKKSELRKEATSTSIQIGASYFERWGVNTRAAYSKFVFKQEANNIEQNEYGFRLYKNIYSDTTNGVFTLYFGNYWITGESISTTIVLYPEATYLNRSKTLLLGFGYANSQYDSNNSSKFHVNQFTATVGFTPIIKTLWLNFKPYVITYDGEFQFSSQMNLSWFIHQSNRLYPTIISFGGLMGKRSYAVEQETMLTYNLSDEQQYSYFITSYWNITDNSHLSLTMGSERFKENTNDYYRYNYINGGLSITW